MDELNNKLNALLPTGIFCCVVGVDIDASRSHAKIWNASLPEVLIVNANGEIKQRCASDHLALGIRKYNSDEMHCQDVHLADGDAIYLYSDGLTEAENNDGEMMGQTGFEQLLASEISEQGRITDIKDKVIKFVDGADATDDISLIEIKTLSKGD